jgi:hypothetical protein
MIGKICCLDVEELEKDAELSSDGWLALGPGRWLAKLSQKQSAGRRDLSLLKVLPPFAWIGNFQAELFIPGPSIVKPLGFAHRLRIYKLSS